MSKSSPISSKIPWYLIIILICLTIGILLLGSFYYRYQQAYFIKEKQEELAAIANLKIRQIVSWRQERLSDAEVIKADHFFAARAKDWLDGNKIPALQEQIFHLMSSFQTFYLYKSVALFDIDGNMRLSTSDNEMPISSYLKSLIREAMDKKQVIFSNLYRAETSKDINLSILAPLSVNQGSDKVLVGVLLLRIDPFQYLYPLVQAWPTRSPSAETLLLSREGNEVLVLNELRDRKDRPLTLRFSLADTKLPAAMAARGEEGVVEGLDYRGIPVVGVVGKIPDSPWFFTVKVDEAEIYGPLKERFHQVALGLIILISIAVLIISLVWRGQQTRFYRKQYELELERSSLASQLLTAQEKERKRISRELHDDLGQSLMVLKMQMRAAEKMLPPDLQEIRTEYARTFDFINTIIEDVRRISRNLSPAVLADHGLAAALRNLIEDFCKGQEIYVVVDIDEIKDLFSPEQESVVYRFFQESLTNIGKYAQATKIIIEVKKLDGQVQIVIEDNGIGFDVEKTLSDKSTGRGIGLVSMQERSRILGGKFNIWSRSGAGTKICISLPLTSYNLIL